MNITGIKQTILNPQTDKQKSDRKKIITTTAAIAIPTTILAIGIGRNPAKAAKYLTGNLNMRKKAYKNASKIIENSMKKDSTIKDWIENLNIKQYIKELPEELSKKETIFYHGTRKSSGIYRHGLNPYESKQLLYSSRELGAGLYLTPSEKVAQYFTHITGKVIPIKVENAKLGMITEEAVQKITENLPELLTKIVDDPMQLLLKRKQSSALTELLVRKIFTEAGYDGIYINKGVINELAQNFTPDINKVLGTDQKQLVLYNTQKAQICSRNFKERVKDLGAGAKAMANMVINTTKEYIRIIKNTHSAIKEAKQCSQK